MMLVFKIFVTEAAVDVPWVLPKEKFFEWEEKDVPFCRKYGFGHAGEPKPSIYQIGRDRLFIHPVVFDQMKKLFPEAVESSDRLMLIIRPPT